MTTPPIQPPGSARSSRNRPSPKGFTLIEAVMAMLICTLILAVMQSMILIAAEATPSDSSAATVSLRTAANLDYLTTDLNSATSFLTLTPTVAEFYLADRDNDGNPDLVRYEWSGVRGAPLLRRYTTDDSVPYDTASTVVPAVDSLSFIPLYRTNITTTTTGGASLGGNVVTSEQTFDAYDTVASTSTLTIRSGGANYFGCAQVITPALPAGSLSYRISRVQLRLSYSRSPYTGTIQVSIRQASGNTPTSTILTSAVVSESSLPSSFGWVNVSFPNCPDLDPAQRYAIAVVWLSDTYAARVQVRNSGITGRTPLCRTNNGSSWATVSGGSMFYRAFGTAKLPQGVAAPVVTTTTTTTTIEGLNVRILPSAPGSKSLETYIQCFNQPNKP